MVCDTTRYSGEPKARRSVGAFKGIDRRAGANSEYATPDNPVLQQHPANERAAIHEVVPGTW